MSPNPSDAPDPVDRFAGTEAYYAAAHDFEDVETETVTVEREWTIERAVGYVFSLSFVSSATLGERRDALEADLREYLAGLDDETFVQRTVVEILSGKK